MKHTYRIRNASRYETSLARQGSPVRVTEYASVVEALRDIAEVTRRQVRDLSITRCGDGDVYVHLSPEHAELDPTGEHVPFIICTTSAYLKEVEYGLWPSEG